MRALEQRMPKVPVMRELQGAARRTTHVHQRGFFLSKGARVEPRTPSVLHAWPKGAPRNRLGLAQRIVSQENPVTARVVVNRSWDQLFGRGLVTTLEDFGTQGEGPTHSGLLDWLAQRFRADWSMRALLRLLVTSEAYCRSSDARPDLARQDPENALYARGPRVRLSAEQLRDQALAVAGLLSRKRFGPPVMPPQPDGVWAMPYSSARWRVSEGADRYRRALYTYWRRTAPYPSMTVFDAPSREVCVPRRIATNTPLQALVMLNDPVFVEAAKVLGARYATGSGEFEELVEDLVLRVFWRTARPAEVAQLVRYWDAEHAALSERGPVEAAREAWGRLVAVLMNLDEFMTKG